MRAAGQAQSTALKLFVPMPSLFQAPASIDAVSTFFPEA
jgi:hypothetical protein